MYSATTIGQPRRARLLLMAYSCRPYRGSEPGIGWNRALEAAKYCDTWVICRKDETAADIEKYQREHGPIDGLHFILLEKRRLQRLLERVPGGYYLGYNLWQRRAFREARSLHAQLRFDLVQQATFIGYREPGYAWQLGIPFVWGPIGGTQNYPWRFMFMEGVRATLGEGFRSLANWIQLRTSRRVRGAVRAAHTIVAANGTIADDFFRVFGRRLPKICDVGISQVSGRPRTADLRAPLRLLWCGVMETRKALPVLLYALADLKGELDFELRVLGEGPRQRSWQRLAKKLGLDGNVSWLGQLPQAEAYEQYNWADLFTFTSLRDTTGTVVLEALGAGLPVVAFDHQGVGEIVTEACGVKIPVDTPAKAIAGWTGALRHLAAHPALREQLSRGACQRAEDYLWSRNGQRMAEIFFQAMDNLRVSVPRMKEHRPLGAKTHFEHY